MKRMLTVALGAWLLAGCSSKVEREFIAGCQSSGAAKSFCSCTYDELEDKLEAAEKNPNLLFSNTFKEAYAKAIQACKG